MLKATPYVLIEMIDEPDCRFVSVWLAKAAEAQTLWSQVFNNVDFAGRIQFLREGTIPDLATSVLEILGELEHWRGVVALALYSDNDDVLCREFGLLVRLGFFVGFGHSYRLGVPERVTPVAVKRAALDLLSTIGDDGDGIEVLRPERLLQTMPKADAEAERLIMMAMRRFRMITAQ
jgi:hypothetical protein